MCRSIVCLSISFFFSSLILSWIVCDFCKFALNRSFICVCLCSTLSIRLYFVYSSRNNSLLTINKILCFFGFQFIRTASNGAFSCNLHTLRLIFWPAFDRNQCCGKIRIHINGTQWSFEYQPKTDTDSFVVVVITLAYCVMNKWINQSETFNHSSLLRVYNSLKLKFQLKNI